MTVLSLTDDISVPLCVDLDGTLVRTDTLIENFLKVLAERPFVLRHVPFWCLKGKAHLKRQLAEAAPLDTAYLPWREDLLDYLKEEKAKGRKLILVSAADQSIAHGVAETLGIFHEVMASDGFINLRGEKKAQVLVSQYGKGAFDYVGNDIPDLLVWQEARKALLAGKARKLVHRLPENVPVAATFIDPPFHPKTLLKAIRIHQWVKNLLVFGPLVLAHRMFSPSLVVAALHAFLAFSLCASSVYLLNDLVDLESDRAHLVKRRRPFASGDLSVTLGLIGSPLLFALSFVLAAHLSWPFFGSLLLYYCVTFVYSFRLKKVVLLDVFALAILYTLRIFAGSIATNVLISAWLMAFSIFFFFDLAIVKRVSELLLLKKSQKLQTKGRDYRVGDLDLLEMCGVSSGFMAVLVLALYINNEGVWRYYHHPEILWAICPILLYWICRIWLVTHRGQMHTDPIVFALRDRTSYFIVLICGLLGYFAS